MVSGLGRETALMQAAEHPGNGTVLEILLKEPDIDINKADKYGQTALMKASYFGRSNAVRLLLRCPKTDVDAAAKCLNCYDGELKLGSYKSVDKNLTALDLAKRGDMAKNYPKFRNISDQLQNDVYVSLQKGFVDIVEAFESRDELLEDSYTCDISCQNLSHDLLKAADDGNQVWLEVLLQCQDVDVNVEDSKGRTPLYLAAYNGHISAVQGLRKPSAHKGSQLDFTLIFNV